MHGFMQCFSPDLMKESHFHWQQMTIMKRSQEEDWLVVRKLLGDLCFTHLSILVALVTGSEREGLCSLGLYHLWFGKDQELFQNDQSTSQVFLGFGWVHPLTNGSLPQARLTGLYSHHLSPIVHVLTSPFIALSLPPVICGSDQWFEVCEAVTSLWSKQAHAPQLTMLNNDSLCFFPLLILATYANNSTPILFWEILSIYTR